MTARVERYYQWVLIACVVLMCVGFGSLATIGFVRSATANEVAALAQTEGRISNVVAAAYGFEAADPAAADRLTSAIADLEAALVLLNGTASAEALSQNGLDSSLARLEGLGTALGDATDAAQGAALAAEMSTTAEGMVAQAKERRIALQSSLDRLTSVFLVTLTIAGLALVGVIYLIALLFSAIKSNLRWNTMVLDALDRGEVAVPSSRLKVNRFFPGAGQMAMQTAELSRRLSDLAEDEAAQARLNARLSRDLQENVDELKASREEFARGAQLAAIGKLAGSVSHEINNPVTGVMGYIAYARKHVDDPTVLMYLEKAAREIERIGRIAKSLLVFSRHNPRNEPMPFDVMPAIDNVVMLARPQMDDARVHVSVETEGTNQEALGHIDAFQQVLLNLLLNARDALRTCDERRITIRVVDNVDSVVVEVIDTGPGVAPDCQDTLFEPFVTTKSAGEGSGLGLAVTRELMLRMGGTSEFDPSYGPGAKFVVTLRAAPAEALVSG